MSNLTRLLPLAFVTLSAFAANNLDSVLTRMDTQAPSFRSMQGKISRVQFTAIVNDTSEELGTIKILKAKGKDVRMVVDFTTPEPKAVGFAGQKVEIYNPKTRIVQEIDLGKQGNLIDQFLLLGFGVTGKELSKAYGVKYIGDETVAGQQASRLELTPKSGKAREHYSKIELWVADPGGYPVRQKLYEPSGNFWTFTYSDLKINPDLKPDQFALDLPKNVKREYPQR